MREEILVYFSPILEKASKAAFARGEAEGIKKGREEGRQQQIALNTVNSFVEGYPLEIIAKINEISIERVKEILRKENLLA